MFTLDLIKERLSLAYTRTDETCMTDDITWIMDTCNASGNSHLQWFERLLDNHFEGIIAHATYKISSGRMEGTPVIFEKTNIFKQTQAGIGSPFHHEAYMWMARKLAQKTGIWMKSVYGTGLDLPKDGDGDYIDEEGQKLPVLPFWGWYLTDGKNEKPDPRIYCFDSRVADVLGHWSMNEDKTMLLTLEIPEKYVLLSDANAWYCALEGRPCYEYEKESVEREKNEAFRRKNQRFIEMPEGEAKTIEAEAIWKEALESWDNILRTEGRRLRNVMGGKEAYDIQAVFPVIMKDWIIAVEDV